MPDCRDPAQRQQLLLSEAAQPALAKKRFAAVARNPVGDALRTGAALARQLCQSPSGAPHLDDLLTNSAGCFAMPASFVRNSKASLRVNFIRITVLTDFSPALRQKWRRAAQR